MEGLATKALADARGIQDKDLVTVHQNVSEYSRPSEDEQLFTTKKIIQLKRMSSDPFSQDKPVKRMKDPELEKYIEKTVDIGLYSEDEVNINMSPEGKMRRQAIHEGEIKIEERLEFVQRA